MYFDVAGMSALAVYRKIIFSKCEQALFWAGVGSGSQADVEGQRDAAAHTQKKYLKR